LLGLAWTTEKANKINVFKGVVRFGGVVRERGIL
jgi:hypothetical protein